MTLNQTATYALTILILGAASALCTALLTQDAVPFGPAREWLLTRFPPRYVDFSDPQNPVTTGTRFGYFLTCFRCVGVWVSFAWFAGWQWGSHSVTVLVATPFAVAAVQRHWNART